VHRDVKPDNLFLVGENGSDDVTVKVIDFGMAKVPRSTGSSAGFVLGTLEYMAPEQIVSESVDGRTDVYGLGVVMFRMFTGHLPFDVSIEPSRSARRPGHHEVGTDLLGHQLFSPAPPPSWLDEGLDPMIERVILSAMRKRPENRYQTMAAMLDDLERAAHLREGGPHGHPLVRLPDVFEPETDRGKEAERFLSSRFKIPATTETKK
jgi:eukaryotic-like serine/threonine-protein kinase